jgi:hypothetical protein
MAVWLSALRAGRPLPPGRFLVLMSLRCWSTQGHSASGRIRSIEKINIIGTRTRDLPACSIMPQPTTLPCVPITKGNNQSSFRILYFSILLHDILHSLCVFIPSITQQFSCLSTHSTHDMFRPTRPSSGVLNSSNCYTALNSVQFVLAL